MTPAEIKAYFAELVTIDDPIIQRAIDVAEITVSVDEYGTRYDLAIKYLTAHFVAFSSQQVGGSGGSVKSTESKSVDGVSVSYGSSVIPYNDMMGKLSATSYGQIFMRLSFGMGAGGFTC